jgi:hypothetical protein
MTETPDETLKKIREAYA